MRRQAFIARQSELPTITMLFAAVHESVVGTFETCLLHRATSAFKVTRKTFAQTEFSGDEFAKVILIWNRCRVGSGSVRLWQSSGLENRRSEAHIPGMATIVQCNCGAEYRRSEEKFLVPHTGDAVCTVCGAALESWRESTHVPTYELIERPERKPE
jgi:hypothetical protein